MRKACKVALRALNEAIPMEYRTSDYLGRYYTRESVASLLINSMGLASPTTVVDLGAGNGALVTEAANQWTAERYLTVDIDERANSGLLPMLRGPSFVHFTGDALDPKLGERIGLGWAQACAAICNPPYIRPIWQEHFGNILEEVGLSHVLPEAQNAPAGILFVAQNLRLLKNGGKLGLILPDGLVTGERFETFRRALIENHSLEQIIELPRNIFRRTEAQTHIVVLSKNGSSKSTVISRKLETNGFLSDAINIPSDEAISRLDYSHHVLSQRRNLHYPKKEKFNTIIASIRRGSYSSSSRKTVNLPIFHTTDLADYSPDIPSDFIISQSEAEALDMGYAREGDILVARVGRNLSRKIVLVKKGPILVTDCFFVLTPNVDSEKALKSLTSKAGREYLDAISQGVGARFITAARLLELELDQ
jgi:type I restriction enzyme M protein